MKQKNIELLSPAGDVEALKAAIDYGADAVYMGGLGYGLRSPAESKVDLDQLRECVEYVHSHGKKIYFTFNIYSRDDDVEGMTQAIRNAVDIGADALIVADLGNLALIRQVAPEMPIHVSTQANITNSLSALTYVGLGAERVVLARECTMEQASKICDSLIEYGKTHDFTPEVETFVHGAMCVSYSGRCLLSNRLTQRDGNRGECAQPCRWKYHLYEESRPGQYFPVETDDRGTYIMNSNDLCMIDHIPELIEAGITSLKIEGRMKTAYYVAGVTAAYRAAIDAYLRDPQEYYDRLPEFVEEVSKTSHRRYYTGFYLDGRVGYEGQNQDSSQYIRGYTFIASVMEQGDTPGKLLIMQRNRFKVGEELEVLAPYSKPFTFTVTEITDAKTGEPMEVAPHAMQKLYINCPITLPEGAILRRKEDQE